MQHDRQYAFIERVPGIASGRPMVTLDRHFKTDMDDVDSYASTAAIADRLEHTGWHSIHP